MSQNFYIQKNRKLIDYKISALNHYVSLSAITISEIIEYIISNHPIDSSSLEMIDTISDLKYINDDWNIEEDGDLIGYIYQQLKCSLSKKKTGQFFTPPAIADYITMKAFENIDNPLCSKILDPACGSGQFLMFAFLHLKKLYLKNGFTEEDANEYIIANNIYGFDIDPISIEIAKYNLSSLANIKDISKINIKLQDFLFKDEMNLISDNLDKNIYSHVIGNPPWGSKFSPDEKKYFKNNYYSAKSGVNSFTLFLERSQDFISPNGTIAFQIPEAYLNIKAHQNSRHDMLSKFNIDNIALWGDQFKNVYAPSISFIIRNENNHEERNSNITAITKASGGNTTTNTLIPQNYYLNTFQNIFSISYSKLSVSLSEQIHNEDCTYLHNRAAFFLGIVTGNNEGHLKQMYSETHRDPILVGSDLKPYQINHSQHYFSYNPESLQQVAPQKYYLTQNKILYKFIGKRLTFALDRDGLYSLNNINGFIPLMHEINPESLISILNSSLMQYYYENTFFTLKVLRGNLERLPIKRITKSNQLLIKKYHDILSIDKPDDTANYKQKIEDIIFHEYNVSDKSINLIKNHLG